VVGGLAGDAATVDGIVVAGGRVDDVTESSSVREGNSSPIVVDDVEVVEVVASN